MDTQHAGRGVAWAIPARFTKLEMPAAKGVRPPNAGKGRKAGVPNKLTKTVKEAFEAAFASAQKLPGVKLEDWMKDNPTEFYKIAAKLIPQDIKASVNAKITAPELAVIASALGIPKK